MTKPFQFFPKLHTAHPSACKKSSKVLGFSTWEKHLANRHFQSLSTGKVGSKNGSKICISLFLNPCPRGSYSIAPWRFKNRPRNPQFHWLNWSLTICFSSSKSSGPSSVRPRTRGWADGWSDFFETGNRKPIGLRMKRLVFCKKVLSSNPNPSIHGFNSPEKLWKSSGGHNHDPLWEQMKPICKE